jgi:hypothetical protein
MAIVGETKVRHVEVLSGIIDVVIECTDRGFEPSARLWDGFFIFHLGPSPSRSEAFEKAKREIARMVVSGDLDGDMVIGPGI